MQNDNKIIQNNVVKSDLHKSPFLFRRNTLSSLIKYYFYEWRKYILLKKSLLLYARIKMYNNVEKKFKEMNIQVKRLTSDTSSVNKLTKTKGKMTKSLTKFLKKYDRHFITVDTNSNCCWLTSFLFILVTDPIFFTIFLEKLFSYDISRKEELVNLIEKEWGTSLYQFFFRILKEQGLLEANPDYRDLQLGEPADAFFFSNYCCELTTHTSNHYQCHEILIQSFEELDKILQEQQPFALIKSYAFHHQTNEVIDADHFISYVRIKERPNLWFMFDSIQNGTQSKLSTLQDIFNENSNDDDEIDTDKDVYVSSYIFFIKQKSLNN